MGGYRKAGAQTIGSKRWGREAIPVANGFAGCIPGIHEVLRRQGLMPNILCLNPHEALSPGQAAEIDRVYRLYPELNDDAFVRAHLAQWQ